MRALTLAGLAVLLATAAPAAPAAPAAAGVLAEVQARGALRCGFRSAPGFAVRDANQNWAGFDLDLCQAVAAAVLGDPGKVEYVAGDDPLAALQAGETDMVSGAVFTTAADGRFDFVAVSYYDGVGFMVRKTSGVASAKDLDGTTVCAERGSAAEANVADYFRSNGMAYNAVAIDGASGGSEYLEDRCEVYAAGVSRLSSTRAAFATPDDHVILPEIISKEPLALAVRHGDNAWGDIVRGTFNALVAAEEYGVSSANLEEQAASAQSPEVAHLLGRTDDIGRALGLDASWARRAIAASGNYGEIFAATIGEQTPIKLARGLNAQWTQGGLMYAPPFR